MDLYSLLPAVIRFKDSLTKGSVGEGVVERIIYMMEQEGETTGDLIAGLLDQINPDECDAKFLIYISLTLGFAVSENAGQPPSEDFARDRKSVV